MATNITGNGGLQFSEYAWQQWAGDTKQVRSNALRANASLPENSWESVDNAVYRVLRDNLTIVNDLKAAGLTKPTDIMTKIDSWNLSDFAGEAHIDMDPETKEDESSLTFSMDGVPVPIIHDDFSLGFRDSPSPDGQNPANVNLDTLGAEATARHCAETAEDLIINGWDQSINSSGDSYSLYGLTSPEVCVTGTTTEDWTLASRTAGTIREDLREMRRILKKDNLMRPGGTGYWVYMGVEYYDQLDDIDEQGDGNLTVRDRVENLSNISQIKEAEYLPDKSVLMFRPTSDVIDLGVAREFAPIQWEDPLRDHWKLMGSVYPRVKKTMTDQRGIVYWTA